MRKTKNPHVLKRQRNYARFCVVTGLFFLVLFTSIPVSIQIATYKRDFSNNRELHLKYLDSLAAEKRFRDGLIEDLIPFVSNPIEVADSLQALAVRLSPDKCIDGYDLAKIIWLESRFDSQAINDDTQALGLIQLLPSVISKFGWDYITILRSSPVEQLHYAEAYIKYWLRLTTGIVERRPHLNLWPEGVQILSVTDLYLIIHYPRSFVYQDTILYKLGTKAYAYNSGLDYNKDSVVDREDIGIKINESPIN